MKAKIVRGNSFRGVLDYVFDQGPKATGDKAPEKFYGTLGGKGPQDLSREFAVVRRLRPEVSRPVWHCSLSLPKGERMPVDGWKAITHNFMARMKLHEHPYVAVRHHDKRHDHVHIVASRIGIDGKLWHGQLDVPKAIAITQRMEREMGLTQTKGLDKELREVAKLTSNERQMEARTGKAGPRKYIQAAIQAAARGGPYMTKFEKRLASIGVTASPNRASTGKMYGYSFEYGGVAFKGSQLGKRYSWNGLQRMGVTQWMENSLSVEPKLSPRVARSIPPRGRGGMER